MSLSLPLLTTKLFAPPCDPSSLIRQALVKKFFKSQANFCLVSAPAGFGKTTLASFLAQDFLGQVAWLSLDAEDSDLKRFMRYFIASLQLLDKTIGHSEEAVLNSEDVNAIGIMVNLINEVLLFEEEAILVLDDYHLVANQEIHLALGYFIEHQPSNLKVIMTSRADPPFALARMRAKGRLIEYRAEDLRFQTGEVKSLFSNNQLDLNEEQLELLTGRTEGWITGLKLAVLSLQNQTDTDAFLKSFGGSHRFIIDYLVEEVLEYQDTEIRMFLLASSVLSRFNASLCNYVLGIETAHDVLAYLEKANLFLIPLDNEREWFRYHHLFADVLGLYLQKEHKELVTELYQKASLWFEQENYKDDAVHYAIAAEDYIRAADLIELAWAEMDQTMQSEIWLKWLELLPQDVINNRPVLQIGYAWGLLDRGKLDAGETVLCQLETFLSQTPKTEMHIVDTEQFDSIQITMLEARAFHAQSKGDLANTVSYAEKALGLAPTENVYRRASAISLLAFANWASGDLEAAFGGFSESSQMLDNEYMAVVAAFFLADIRLAQGKLGDAESLCKEALKLVESKEQIFPGTKGLYVGLAEVAIERGKYNEAAAFLEQAELLEPEATMSSIKYRWYIAMALLKEAQEKFEVSLNYLSEAEFWYLRGPISNFRPFDAIKVRIYLKQGQLKNAIDLAERLTKTKQVEAYFLFEYQQITLLKVLVVQFQLEKNKMLLDQATLLSEQLAKQARAQKRTKSLIEILLVQSLIQLADSQKPKALVYLSEAIELAEVEGFRHVFFQEKELRLLILETSKNKQSTLFGRNLAEHFEKGQNRLPSVSNDTLFEPLSDRELEILRLLPTGRSSPDLASHMGISVNTVKTHIKNIYSKLAVHKRHEAVTRAKELGYIQ